MRFLKLQWYLIDSNYYMARKVIFCGNSLSGMFSFRWEVMQEFKNQGWDVYVISPKYSASEEVLEKFNKIGKVFLLNAKRDSMNPFEDLGYFIKLLQIYKKLSPDLVFHYTIKPNIYGTFAASLLRIPSVAMVAGLGYIFDGGGIVKKFARQLYKLGLRTARRVLVLNRSNAEVLESGGYVRPNNMIHLEGGEGVDLYRYPYYEDKHFDQPKFLMVARILYDKGYKEYVEAAKLIKQSYPNIEFELLGPIDRSSPMRVLESTIKSDCESGAINYLGVTSDVPSIICRDGIVLVLPSKYHEGLNRSLMEGCSMGRPIITTDIPGCKETVEEGENGYLCKKGDASSLAQSILKFINLSEEAKKEMGVKSRQLAENKFDIKKCIEIYKRIASELVLD